MMIYVYATAFVIAAVVVTVLFFKIRADDLRGLRGLSDELGMMEGGDDRQ